MRADLLFFSCNEYFTIDENSHELEFHLDYEDYLYRSNSSTTPFVIYEEELKRLNDYLVFLLQSSNEQKREEVDSFSEITLEDNIVGVEEFEMVRDMAELAWSYNINSTLFSLGITLILSFLESCLFDLSSWIAPSSTKKAKRNKIESYLQILNNSLNTGLVMSERLVKSRKLRNKFVHNQLGCNKICEKDLRCTIDEVVRLLFEIEDAIVKRGII